MDPTGHMQSFLPVRLLGRLHGGGGRRPSAVTVPGAVLFIDVSRFTAVVEHLARRGHAGLETIPKLLSASYARCADEVEARGGEVVSFAGDGLLACWTAADGDLAPAVRAAADCAGALCQEHLGRSANSMNGAEPALHFGVGAGHFWAAAVGGEPVWNLVIGGRAVIDAASALLRARSWTCELSDAAAGWLTQPQPPVDLITSVEPAEAATSRLPADWLSGFLAPQLETVLGEAAPHDHATGYGNGEDRLTTRLEALTEIRPVSALFARIAGLDTDSRDALQRHHDLCRSIQRALHDCGGPPGELLFDDKGLMFIAVFGSRGSFHRDDPQRAVASARAIAAAVAAFGLHVSIGVATGDASFRVVGSRHRRQLMALGQPLNRASRLTTTIVGDILCDAPTERAARGAYTFERCGTLQLEGLGDMAPVFRPADVRSTAPAATWLVGREIELTTLRSAFADARAGASRLVALLGAPGIGKSALVNAFAEELRADGTAVSMSRGERDDRRTSLLAWRHVLESMADLPLGSGGATALRAITGRLAGDPAFTQRLPLLGDVLGVETAQSEATRHLDGPYRADATMRLVGDTIGALAPRPMVLVLEDCQWLDSASWRLVEWVLASQSSLLLAVCVRAEEIPDEFRSLRQRAESGRIEGSTQDPTRELRVIELAELADGSIHDIVARTLGGPPPQGAVARRIAALAGGNPFFAEEIALTLKGEGLIAERGGYWRPLRPLDELRYFESVERVIRERVDHLDPAAQDVIRVATVIGRTFAADALAALYGGPIEAPLDSLVEAQLVGPAGEPGHFRFRHDQIRDVIYATIPSDQRARLHDGLAAWYETGRDGAPGPEVAVLVKHFEAAGNAAKAVRYADLAATHALQIGAFREVESFIGICLDHEPLRPGWSDEQRLTGVRWRRQLAEAHYSRGDIHAQGVAVRHALSVAGKPVPTATANVLARLAMRALRLTVQQVLPPKPHAGGRAAALKWEEELARCLNQAAMVDYFELRFSRCMCNLVGAVVHAERAGVTPDVVIASAQLACGLGVSGWQQASAHFMGRAETAAITLADPALHAHVCNLDALWQLGRGLWDGVDHRLDMAQTLALTAGDQLRWCNAQGMRFWSRYYRGEQSEWEPIAQVLLARSQNAGNMQQEVWALRCKGLCLLHTDRPREAAEILRLITSDRSGGADRAAQISAMGALALALSRIGQPPESVQAVTETLRLLREMRRPSSHSVVVGICDALEVLLRGREAGLADRYEHWRTWESQALHELRRYCKVFPVGLAQLGLWSGVADWLDGRRDAALAGWRQALETSRRLSLRKDEALIAAEIRGRQGRI